MVKKHETHGDPTNDPYTMTEADHEFLLKATITIRTTIAALIQVYGDEAVKAAMKASYDQGGYGGQS